MPWSIRASRRPSASGSSRPWPNSSEKPRRNVMRWRRRPRRNSSWPSPKASSSASRTAASPAITCSSRHVGLRGPHGPAWRRRDAGHHRERADRQPLRQWPTGTDSPASGAHSGCPASSERSGGRGHGRCGGRDSGGRADTRDAPGPDRNRRTGPGRRRTSRRQPARHAHRRCRLLQRQRRHRAGLWGPRTPQRRLREARLRPGSPRQPAASGAGSRSSPCCAPSTRTAASSTGRTSSTTPNGSARPART